MIMKIKADSVRGLGGKSIHNASGRVTDCLLASRPASCASHVFRCRSVTWTRLEPPYS